jgi:hypothetical protein
MLRPKAAQVFSWAVLGFVIVFVGFGSSTAPIALSREHIQQSEILKAFGMDPRLANLEAEDYVVIQVSLALLFLALLAVSTQSVVGLSLAARRRGAAAVSLIVGVVGMLVVIPSTCEDLGGLLVQAESEPAVRVPTAVLACEALLLLCFLVVSTRQARSEPRDEITWLWRGMIFDVVLTVVSVASFSAIEYGLNLWAGFRLAGLKTTVLPEGLEISIFPVGVAVVAFVVAFAVFSVLALGMGQEGPFGAAPPLLLPGIALLVVGGAAIGDWRDVLASGFFSAVRLGGESLLWRISVSALMGIGAGLAVSSFLGAGVGLFGGTSRSATLRGVLGRARIYIFGVSFCVVFVLGNFVPGFLAPGERRSAKVKVRVFRSLHEEPVGVLGIAETQLLRIGSALGQGCLFCGWAVNAEAAGTAELRYSCEGGQKVAVLQKEGRRIVARLVPRAGRVVRGFGGCAVLPAFWGDQQRLAANQALDVTGPIAKGELPTFEVFCGNAKDAFVLAARWWGKGCRPRTQLFLSSRTGSWWEVPVPFGVDPWWSRAEENGVTLVGDGACASEEGTMSSRGLSLFWIGSREAPRVVTCVPWKVLERAGIDTAWVVADVSGDGRYWLFRYRFDTVRRWKYVLVDLDSGRAMPLPFRAAVAFFVPETLAGPLLVQDGEVDLRLPRGHAAR